MIGDIIVLARYLKVQEVPVKMGAVTKRWTVHSGNVPDGDVGELIATVSWWAPWRRYCVEADHGVVFDGECLAALGKFVEQMSVERRAERT